jgi:hypothetical protein
MLIATAASVLKADRLRHLRRMRRVVGRLFI